MIDQKKGYTRQVAALTAELQKHIKTLVIEAQAGDYEARTWLCESFPGYTAFFQAVWHQEKTDSGMRV